MNASEKSVVVVGGINTDICGHPSAALVMHDSNPGSVSTTPGGVGRNIAHNLALLGIKTSLITAVGGDSLSASLVNCCKKLGIDMQYTIKVPEASCPMYLYITNESGDMLAAVNDMTAIQSITPEVIQARLSVLNSADAVVIDANLPQETIEFIAENCTVPLYADAVSAAKVSKLSNTLSRLNGFKPNALEAQMLTGTITPQDAVQALCKKGICRVFLSMGANGILASDGKETIKIPAFNTDVINTTGAGDSATAALVYAGVYSMSLEESALLAARAGAMTAACAETNCPDLHKILENY